MMYQVRCFCACGRKAALLIDVANVGGFVEEWLTFHAGPACFPEVYCASVQGEGQHGRQLRRAQQHEEGQSGRKAES